MREQVIHINFEADDDKKEELITGYLFDAMFAVQDGIDQLVLKSRGRAINICVQVTLEIEKRLEQQMISAKKKIYLNSRFLRDKQNPRKMSKKSQNTHRNNLIPPILSSMDVKFFLQS